MNKLELFYAVEKEKDFEWGLKWHPNTVAWYSAHGLSDMTTIHVPKCVGVNFIPLGVLCWVYSRKRETDEKYTFCMYCFSLLWSAVVFFIQVEALLSYRVMDIACGSGDAQTLCITDDDNVWSWGDGDYGKLGRGGSDGCKVSIFLFS